MDDEAIEKALKDRFAFTKPVQVSGSIESSVMNKIARLEHAATQPAVAAERSWVLGFAVLVGCLVSIPSVYALDPLGLIQVFLGPALDYEITATLAGLGDDLLNRFAQMDSTLYWLIAMATLLLLPIASLVFDE